MLTFPACLLLKIYKNLPEITSCAVEEVFQTIKITPFVVRNKLYDLNPNKSPGHYQWYPHFF